MPAEEDIKAPTTPEIEAQIKLASTCCYKWDNKLKLSDPEFGQRLHNRRYDSSLGDHVAFPTDYALALFSQTAYQDKDYHLPSGWELLTTATNTSTTNGYFGIAVWNPKLCQIVVAHRGTKLTNIGALISDLLLSLNKEKTGQSQSAATFVHLVKSQIRVRSSESGPRFQLSITGHSLGAWLAQVTTFTVKYFKREQESFVEDKNYVTNIHPHTVVFESPGCKQAFVKLVKYFIPRYAHRKYGNYDTLDMTVYLSQLNPINSINEHVGTIYIVRSQTHSIKDTIELFDPNTSKIEREMVLDFRSGMLASAKSLFKKLVPYSSSKILKKRVKENEYSLNVFNEKELGFVKDWVHVIKLNFLKVLQFKSSNKLPDFDIDDEYNVIKGPNLNSTIACIKRLRPSKTQILQLIKEDATDRVHYEIFKLKTQQFEKNLLQFSNYYFKDKYKLKEFLDSKTQILHIRVDKNSKLEFELETSILNSVFTFYKNNDSTLVRDYLAQNRYGFVTWDTLQGVLEIVKDMFENEHYKVNLLVVECFEVEDHEQAAVLEFLKNTTVKLILLSTDELSWRNEISDVQEVDGFGSNIKFEDLTADCQKQFFMQKNLKLHEREISLNDIIDESFPFSDEVYKRLNKAIPANVLLELMLTPITEAIVLDCPFSNVLKGVVFHELHRKVDFSKLKVDSNGQSLFIVQADTNPDWLQSDGNRSNLKIMNKVNFLKECLENFHRVVYLFSLKNDELFLETVFNKDFYIARNIVNQRSISSFIFEDLKDDLDYFYVCGDEKKFKEYVSKENREWFRFIPLEEKAKERVKSAKDNAHLLRIEDEKIEWLYSCGTMEYMRKYLLQDINHIDEKEVLQNDDVVIIAGEPGIGKSSTLGLHYLNLQKTRWVFAVPLRHSAFDDLSANIDFDYVAVFILKTCGIYHEGCVQHILSYCLKNQTNLPICLLFDAFDEIHDENIRKKFIDIVNFLKYSSKVKILITTRKYRCKELENGVSVFASHFEPINSETKAVNFLTTFWNSQLCLFEDVTDTEELQRFAKDLIQGAEDLFGETISSFIGVPMHLRMLAEVVAPSSSSSLHTVSMDVLDLFQKYTQTRYDLYFERFAFLQNETVRRWLSDDISTKLYQLAILKAFGVEMKSIEYSDVEELNKIGIIQSDPDYSFNYEFLHDSVRDYFIAYLLKLWLELRFELYHSKWNVKEFIILDFLLYPQYKEMRFFLNCYLKNSAAASKERIEMCRKGLKQLWEDDSKQFFVDQESAFHMCAKENLCFLLKYFLFPITDGINKIELLSKRNSNLETPLYLAALSVSDTNEIILQDLNHSPVSDIKTILLATLLNYFITDEHLRIFRKHSSGFPNIQNVFHDIQNEFSQMSVFLQACKSNDLNKLNIIMQQYQNDKITRDCLLQVTNELKETCLHLTSDIQLVDRLLKLGANKDAQDHHGMTPLARAIKCGNAEIAGLLIKKGADTTIEDNIHNSPLNHAAKYNNLDVGKLLLSSKTAKVDVDHTNIFHVTPLMLAAKNGNEAFVRYLLDKGADVSATDWNGMTPVYHAVKGDNTNLIRLFKQKGAELDILDDFRITPLMYSIMRSRWNAVTSLLDNGADVNIGDRRNGYPLQLLIKKDRPAIVKKLFKEDTKNVNKKVIRADVLTDEEKDYINKLLNPQTKKLF